MMKNRVSRGAKAGEETMPLPGSNFYVDFYKI